MDVSANGPAVIVDPYSSGAFFAGAFAALNVPVVALLSAPQPPDVYAASFRPNDFQTILVAEESNFKMLVDKLVQLAPRCILTGCESGVELTDRIAPLVVPEVANVPSKAAARRHKGEMANAIQAAGIPSMRQICTSSLNEVEQWINREGLVGKELVIKPPKSASTDGVVKVRSGQDWRKIFMNTLGSVNRLGINNDTLMVQEFLQGTEYAVDTASYDGRHAISSICRYNKTDNGPFMAVYDTMDWMPPDFEKAKVLREYALKVLDAVGMRYGTSHVEIMLTAAGPRLVEIGARPHGGGHPQFCRQATGDSQIDLIARSFSANRFDQFDYKLRINMQIVFLLCRRAGVVTNSVALEHIKNLPSHFFSRLNIKSGDQLEPTKDLFGSLEMGFVALSHNNPEVIKTDYQTIRALEESLFEKDVVLPA